MLTNALRTARAAAPALLVTAACLILAGPDAAAALPELWRLPGGTVDRPYLTTTGDTQRGLAYNAANNHLYLASRAAGTGNTGIFILDANDGAHLGSLNTTGITGGTFAFSMLGTGSDGAIYAANLTTNSATSPFKIYRWANESAAPTVAYTGNPLGGTTVGRFGDSFDVTSSGTGTLLAAGRGNSGDPSGVALFNTANGADFSAVASAPPSTGNYRQSVAFGGPGELYGKESGDALRRGTFDALTLAYTEANSYPTASFPSGNGPMDVDAGRRLLAALNTGTHVVSLYDVSDTASPPVLLDSATLSGTLNANANAAGQVVLDTANNRVFVLDTNNGIAALTIPEPGSATTLVTAGLLALTARRRYGDRQARPD